VAVRELRASILKKCDAIQAILSFNYRLGTEDKRRLDQIRRATAVATKRELQAIHETVTDNEIVIARRFGCRQKPSVFAEDFISACKNPLGELTISKAGIDTDYFSNFCDGSPLWRHLPAHLRVCLDYNRITNGWPCEFDYFLPEAMLYEDMALSFNEALRLQSLLPKQRPKSAGIEDKKLGMRLRTSLLSAYYFVEAYLNGIAFDFEYASKSNLTVEQQDLLLEWDSRKNKRSLVSFDRKAIEYPKLILGTNHPPLTVTNCPSLRVLLGEARLSRDSIVHQSPKVRDPEEAAEKVGALLQLRIDLVTDVVDSAVQFIQQLDDLLPLPTSVRP